MWTVDIAFFGLVLAVSAVAQDAPVCSVDCKTTAKKKPVCASDGQSYPSKCEVRRQRICLGKKNLQWVYEGECTDSELERSTKLPAGVYGLPKKTDSPAPRNCTDKRAAALQDSQKLAGKRPGSASNVTNGDIMIPSCKVDGSYEQVQCHPSTGYCWCVHQRTGVPIPQTTQHQSRPDCGADGGDDSQDDAECEDADRSKFNTDLLSRFKEKYDTISADDQRRFITGYDSIEGMTEINAKVAAWRFNSLDKNGDMHLNQQELKDLRRDVRKNVKPKSCAKQFLNSCDKNSDSLITYQEWNVCLGGTTHLSFRLFLSLSAMAPQDQLTWDGNLLPIHDQSQSSGSKDNKNSPELMEHQKRLFHMLTNGTSGKDRDDSSSKLRNGDQVGNDRIDRSPSDRALNNLKLVSLATKTCEDERESALAKMNDQTFVPRCQADGKYETTQCHTFSGYCWCVDPESGMPISGTSKLKERPECDSVTGRPITDRVVSRPRVMGNGKARGKNKNKNRKKLREIPGCPSPNHGAFLTQLVDLLTREMASAGGDLPPQLTNSANMSLEEKAVRWKAITSDRNNDKKLSKKEMRFVRHMSKEKLIKAPEKCAKKFIKYCDGDEDNYLTVDELLICTGVRKKARRSQRKQQSKGSGQSRDGIRHGIKKNPFTNLLTPS